MQTQVAALWERKGTSKDGKEYRFLSGPLGYVQIPAGAGLIVRKNPNKTEGGKQPDYYVYVEEPYVKGADQAKPAGGYGEVDIPF